MDDKYKDQDGFFTAAPPAPSTGVNELAAKLDDLKTQETNLQTSSYDVVVTLADQQADPNSPLHSVKTFEELGLHPDLLKGIYGMGFKKPSKIQERALPLMLQDPPRNMIAQSQSGTGKTAAFVLTMLSRIDFTQNYPQALCVAPTRELARQIMAVVVEMGKNTPIQTAYAIKDAPTRDTKVTQHIVVGTPGTMGEMLRRRQIDPARLKVFVLDEADHMLDGQGLAEFTLRIKNQISKEVQKLLFSATFTDHVRVFASKFAPDANVIALKKEELYVEGIKQFYFDCHGEAHKFKVLVELYGLLTIGQSIIFCKRRETADQIASRMITEGHHVTSLHGAKDARERDQVIDDFRDGKSKVLITTNVLARGIDILQVNMVVNYDMPLTANHQPDVETYLHRIGRTGRFGRQGISVNFVHDQQSWDALVFIEKAIQRDIQRIKTENFDDMERDLKKILRDEKVDN
ncbi:ATP-dependent RNA helicase DBP5 [Gautieria morchelliformis]|nr:ATP-dependent RNA helicase DBP5 [Gautieria morchelliformis]